MCLAASKNNTFEDGETKYKREKQKNQMLELLRKWEIMTHNPRKLSDHNMQELGNRLK